MHMLDLRQMCISRVEAGEIKYANYVDRVLAVVPSSKPKGREGKVNFVLAASMADGTQRFVHVRS